LAIRTKTLYNKICMSKKSKKSSVTSSSQWSFFNGGVHNLV
jgi:hypothetical protein